MKRKLDTKESLNLHSVHRLTSLRNGDVWKRKEAKNVIDEHIINLYADRDVSIHLEAKNQDIRNEWFEALKFYFDTHNMNVDVTRDQ